MRPGEVFHLGRAVSRLWVFEQNSRIGIHMKYSREGLTDTEQFLWDLPLQSRWMLDGMFKDHRRMSQLSGDTLKHTRDLCFHLRYALHRGGSVRFERHRYRRRISRPRVGGDDEFRRYLHLAIQHSPVSTLLQSDEVVLEHVERKASELLGFPVFFPCL